MAPTHYVSSYDIWQEEDRVLLPPSSESQSPLPRSPRNVDERTTKEEPPTRHPARPQPTALLPMRLPDSPLEEGESWWSTPSAAPAATDHYIAKSAVSQPTFTYTPTVAPGFITMSGQQPQIDPRLGVSYAQHLPPNSTSTSTPTHQQSHHRPPHYGDLPHVPAPPAHMGGGRGSDGGVQNDRSMSQVYGSSSTQSPQPYYYPTPPNPAAQAHTPAGASHGAPSIGSASNQPSPNDTHNSMSGLPYGVDHQHESPGHHDGSGGERDGGDDSKRPRACEACRGLKVRCDQDPQRPDIPCKRCAKAGRQCVITQPNRKRQKKADSRVAELEKKLDALTAVLHQQQGSGQQYGHPSHPGAPTADMMQGRRSAPGFGSGPYPMAPPQDRPNALAEEGPAVKRQRIDDNDETPTLDGADVTVAGNMSRYSSAPESKDSDDPVPDDMHASWSARTDLKRYLHQTSPDEFVERVNSLVSPDMAASIFNRYTSELSPQLPAVVFPPGTSAEQVFREKPILYVCILSAASFGPLHPETSKALQREATGAIADCVVRNGAKSLELIQAMQVMALWYKPPEQTEQTNFYQIIHMAAVMALDIGLGKRFSPKKSRRGFGVNSVTLGVPKTVAQDSDTIEARRAWLGCYYLCASSSMVLRRPNLVRWTNYMKECIEMLETHPDAFPSDKLFCQHVKIQHICEDIGLQFLMDDSSATISITDPKVSYALNVLENQLKNWKQQIPDEMKDLPGLRFFEHVTSLYLHEIALHFNHNIEDFRLPFTEESLKSVNNTSDTLTQNQMAALEACLTAAHGILETMISYDTRTLKSLPMLLYFVRCVYAIVILIKMHVAVCTPGSELGKMMRPEDLKVGYYVDSLIQMFAYATKENPTMKHPKVLRILSLLRDWFKRHEANIANGGNRSSPERQEQSGGQQQTPLHLLSQVATGDQQQQQLHQQQQQSQPPRTRTQMAGDGQRQDWTYDSPLQMSYPPPTSQTPAEQRLSVHNAPDASSTANNMNAMPYPPNPQDPNSIYVGDGQGMMDPLNPSADYGWGSGFEQAMDIALGGMDGLQGEGLGGWFLGDSMAPFGFDGQANAATTAGQGGQW